MVANTTATVSTPLRVNCATCGRKTTECNLNFDYKTMTAMVVCEHCRSPLPRREGTNG